VNKAAEEANAAPAAGLASSSPFGERVKRATSPSNDADKKPLTSSSPAPSTSSAPATATTTTASLSLPNSPSVAPAKASPFGPRVTRPGAAPAAAEAPAEVADKKEPAAGGSGASPLLKAVVEKAAQEEEKKESEEQASLSTSTDDLDILKRRYSIAPLGPPASVSWVSM
jgi:hypothetical protein